MAEDWQPFEFNQKHCVRCGAGMERQARFCPNCRISTDSGAPQPGYVLEAERPEVEYMGFWIRLLAAFIDALIIGVLNLFLSRIGLSFLAIFVGATYAVLFIGLKGQTPGKMALGLKVIDAHGNVPGLWRAVLREIIGKFISSIALGLGYAWIGWDPRKQGWHDHITGTFVVRKEREREF